MNLIGQLMYKLLLQVFRRKDRILITILAPIIFFSFFGFVFTAGDMGEEVFTSRNIGFINLDEGYQEEFEEILPNGFPNTSNNLGDIFIDMLQNNQSELIEGNVRINLALYTDEDLLYKDVETQILHLGILIPADFTFTLLNLYNLKLNQTSSSSNPTFPLINDYSPMNITTLGDQSVQEFFSAQSAFESAYQSFVNLMAGDSRFGLNTNLAEYYFEENGVQGEEFNGLDMMAPGFLTFLVILQIIIVASILAEEKEKQTIHRMRMSLLPNWLLFTGILLTQFIVVSMQIIVSIITLELWGFHLSFFEWIQVAGIMQMANLNLSGFALIIASYVKKSRDAVSISAILSAPIGFLSGSFLPVPETYIIKEWGVQFWDVVPTYHANAAITLIVEGNQSFWGILSPVLWLFAFAIVWLGIGLFVYNLRVSRE